MAPPRTHPIPSRGAAVFRRLLLLPVLFLAPTGALPQKPDTPKGPAAQSADAPASDPYAGLRLRSIGPALFSGRIAGLAIHPRNPAHYFAAVASGGVWKTTNDGTTWTPVFDDQGSYSIGYIALDPKDPQ